MHDKSCDFSPTVLINKRVQCGGVAGENLYESGHVSFFDKVTSYLTTAQIRKIYQIWTFLRSNVLKLLHLGHFQVQF